MEEEGREYQPRPETECSNIQWNPEATDLQTYMEKWVCVAHDKELWQPSRCTTLEGSPSKLSQLICDEGTKNTQ